MSNQQALSTVGSKGLELNTLHDLLRFSKLVIESGLAPGSFKSEAQIIVAVQMGMEAGLSPMQSLHSIAVINGTPSIYGDAGTALVRGSGLLEDSVETFVGEGDELTAVCKLKRAGQPGWITGSFSVKDAKLAKLWGKSGPWTTYPRRMLMWRARSWAYRDGFADALRGMRFVEETRDLPPRSADYEEQRPKPEDLLPPMEPVEVAAEEPEPKPKPELDADEAGPIPPRDQAPPQLADDDDPFAGWNEAVQ